MIDEKYQNLKDAVAKVDFDTAIKTYPIEEWPAEQVCETVKKIRQQIESTPEATKDQMLMDEYSAMLALADYYGITLD